MKFTERQQCEHEQIMRVFCEKLLAESKPMVLKGGTALRLCYGLDRFSEDLDFDSAVPLKLEHFIADVFRELGKNKPHLRNPKVTLTKETKTVRRYRVEYGESITLKIETSLRGTPDENDLVEVNGILTYKITNLISQKISALQGRTTARDLHDVIFLFENFYGSFTEEQIASVVDLYDSQSDVMMRFNPAYDEDSLLNSMDLVKDLMKLIELVEEKG